MFKPFQLKLHKTGEKKSSKTYLKSYKFLILMKKLLKQCKTRCHNLLIIVFCSVFFK